MGKFEYHTGENSLALDTQAEAAKERLRQRDAVTVLVANQRGTCLTFNQVLKRLDAVTMTQVLRPVLSPDYLGIRRLTP